MAMAALACQMKTGPDQAIELHALFEQPLDAFLAMFDGDADRIYMA